ncbi:hypothetical protein HK405_005566 [Cladochytrium tenue]|nr:hypothetical protein HK405_005566 [Cladochytrium tenue]
MALVAEALAWLAAATGYELDGAFTDIAAGASDSDGGSNSDSDSNRDAEHVVGTSGADADAANHPAHTKAEVDGHLPVGRLEDNNTVLATTAAQLYAMYARLPPLLRSPQSTTANPSGLAQPALPPPPSPTSAAQTFCMPSALPLPPPPQPQPAAGSALVRLLLACPDAAEAVVTYLDVPGPLLFCSAALWHGPASSPGLRASWMLARPPPAFLALDGRRAWPHTTLSASVAAAAVLDAAIDADAEAADAADAAGALEGVGPGVWALYAGVRARIATGAAVAALNRLLTSNHCSGGDPFRLPAATRVHPRLVYLLGRLRSGLARGGGDADTCVFALRHGLLGPQHAPQFVRAAWAAGSREACFAVLDAWAADAAGPPPPPVLPPPSTLPALDGKEGRDGQDVRVGLEASYQDTAAATAGERRTRLFLGSPELRVWILEDLVPADDADAVARLCTQGLRDWTFALEAAAATGAGDVLGYLLANGHVARGALAAHSRAAHRLVDGSNYHPGRLLARLAGAGLDVRASGDALVRAAAAEGNAEVAAALVSLGADALAPGPAGEPCAADVAAAAGHTHLARVLRGAKPASLMDWLVDLYTMV